jgi:glycerol-3-phosphate dehydrogenase (NAD(P)+)
VGDLMVTGISPHSRNRYVGEQLGWGRRLEEILTEMSMVAEGVRTAAMVNRLARDYGVDMPVCRDMHRVVSGEITADQAYRGLRTAPGHELEPG